MNDPLTIIEQAARYARRESVRTHDVTTPVLQQLRRPPEPAAEMPYAVFTIAYVALAAVIIVFGFSLFQSMTDPFISLAAVANLIAI